MTRVPDPQQQKCYRWEATWRDWNQSTLTLTQCRDAIRWACSRYGLKVMPAVKQHTGGDYAWALTGPGQRPVISMQAKTSKNLATVMHEAAHVVTDTIFVGQPLADHSPEFMGVYMGLLEDAQVAPVIALHTTARSHGLRWLPYDVISPARIKGLATASARA